MSYRLQVLIPEEMDQRIRKAARRLQVSKGEWVRRAIDRALASDRAGEEADPVRALADLGGPTGDIERMLDDIEAGRG